MDRNELFGIASGALIAVLILLYSGMVVWAWSKRQRASFEAAARLPLEEDHATLVASQREQRP